MHIINKPYTNLQVDYDFSKLAPVEDILFLDIETTGFSAATSFIYMIGCAFYNEGCFNCRQFFAENQSEEKEILVKFLEFADNYKLLIHFNGNNFDIPYIQAKCQKYELVDTLSGKTGIDLYKRIAPYKALLKLPNCKQKTLEQFIGINREDQYSGGDLINVYLEYVKQFSIESLSSLLLHNENDIQGMIEITPLLSYHDLFDGKLKVTKVTMDRHTDFSGKNVLELVMKCELQVALPASVSGISSGIYYSFNGNTGTLKVPVYEGELKYFYANYKDYYYLPEEDLALHKSVASFVDKDHRVQATASTCYTRVSSKFLRQYSYFADPFYKEDYSAKEIYLEITDARKKDRQFFADYALSILKFLTL